MMYQKLNFLDGTFFLFFLRHLSFIDNQNKKCDGLFFLQDLDKKTQKIL